MFWKTFPSHKPKKDGWYQCTIAFPVSRDTDGSPIYQTYVMDLYWYGTGKQFVDNRRKDVFREYNAYAYDDTSKKFDKQIFSDSRCYRTSSVIAWKKMPRTYRQPGMKVYKMHK